MAKIVNISEIHPTLGFTEFDILLGLRFVRLEKLRDEND